MTIRVGPNSTGAWATLRVGATPKNAYTAEYGQTSDGVVSDLSFVRIQANTSRGTLSPSSFYGQTALRIEVNDTTSVVSAGTAPYMYGARIRVSPRINRTQVGIDDTVGVCVTNGSFNDYGTPFSATEALYVGWGGGSTGGASKDFTAGLGVDTVADNGIYINRGPYNYGILILAPCSTAAIRIPNNSPIVGRNAADTASNDILRLDTNGNVKLGTGAVKVVVGAPTNATDVTQPFEVQSGGITDGNLGHSHTRVVDTTAFAANVGGAVAFAGYTDATPTIRTFGAVTGRKANATGGNSGGYLSFWSRNAGTGLVEVLRLTELQALQVADGSNFTFGTTTGTQLGSAASQKLAHWGATPVVQPTTAGAAATFVANAGTALQDVSTFDGYTLAQVVKALRTVGILA